MGLFSKKYDRDKDKLKLVFNSEIKQYQFYYGDILINGLLITGHMGSGAISTPELGNNVSYYPDNKTIIKELMYADTYKNSRGSILIKIPDEDLTKNIFITTNGQIRLNPKYIIGYIPVSNHHIETIITREDILKQKRIENNNYANDTLETIKHR